ncbi:interleukin-20-like [Discoglossus pictus]
MKALSCCFWICLIGFLLMEMQSIEASRSQCPYSANIHELRKHFAEVKEFLHSEDKITGNSLLKKDVLDTIEASERCCVLLKLGRFYLTNVFPNLKLTSKKISRSISHLANSMLGLKIDLKYCYSTMRCPCGTQSHSIMEDFEKEFSKVSEVSLEAAVVKAAGDLYTLFNWMKHNFLG